MAKTTALDIALDFIKSKGTVTPDQLNKHVGKGNYASKYILYLKLAGHDISTVKSGRTVVSYTYVGINPNVDTSIKKSDRRAHKVLNSASKATVKSAEPKEVEAKAEKVKAKPVAEKTGGKHIMTKEEIKKATAAIQRLREKKQLNDDVKEDFAPSRVASSHSVDADWDKAPTTLRELGV